MYDNVLQVCNNVSIKCLSVHRRETPADGPMTQSQCTLMMYNMKKDMSEKLRKLDILIQLSFLIKSLNWARFAHVGQFWDSIFIYI